MIRTTEVDGVPTLITPAAGPVQAGLVFRVGRADESLARGGVTHLVEHLALHRTGLTDYHYNGATTATTTHFHMRGSESDVVTFLAGVCEGLTNIPVDRIETEKALLRTEWASRTRSVVEDLPLWRYGARGFGLLSYPEWGLGQLRVEELDAWVETWFTRENAVLWIAGDDVPSGLRLALPAAHATGGRRPIPKPSSALPVTPAYFTGTPSGVVFDALVSRGPAATVFTRVLERELFRSLRQDGGYSYTASAAYDTRGDDVATVTAIADALPEQQGAVLGGFIDVLMGLKVGRIESAEIDAVLTSADESLRRPEAEAARLPSASVNLLTGHPIIDIEEYGAALRAVTVEDVHGVAVEAMESALLMVPDGHRADWAGFTLAPTWSASVVEGERYPSVENDEVGLVIGPTGASLVTGPTAVTVRFDECAAKLSWPDGARQLIGDDGMVVRIEPTLFAIDPSVLAEVEAAVDPSVTVGMPGRDPGAIPRPTPRPPQQALGSGHAQQALGRGLALGRLWVMGLPLGRPRLRWASLSGSPVSC